MCAGVCYAFPFTIFNTFSTALSPCFSVQIFPKCMESVEDAYPKMEPSLNFLL